MTLCYLALTVFALLGQSVADVDDEYHLGKHQAGSVHIGTTIDDVYREFGRDNIRLIDLHLEGHFSPGLEIRIPGGPDKEPSLILRIMWWREIGWGVSGISVNDTRFRTEEGLGIGSTFEAIERAYKVRKGSGAGKSGAYVDSLSMTFFFSVSSPLAEIAEDSLCKGVWVFGIPDRIRDARKRERENKRRK